MNSVSATVATADNLKAMRWAIVYAALIAGMHVCIRLVSEGMHPFEIAFFRNIFALLVLIRAPCSYPLVLEARSGTAEDQTVWSFIHAGCG